MDFKTTLVTDSAIALQEEATYKVTQGAAAKTFQQFIATTFSNSQLSFVIQCPNESVIIDRKPLIQGTIQAYVRITNVPVNSPPCNWAQDISFQAFPLTHLQTNATCLINNTNVSCQINDVIDPVLRMNDSREQYRWSAYTPSYPDSSYYNYVDGVNANNNALAGYTNTSYDVDQVPRGAFPATVSITQYNAAGAPVAGNPIDSADVTNFFIVQVTATFTEPVFLSPFSWAEASFNSQGLCGINTLNFQFTLDAGLNRLFSVANRGYTYTKGAGVYATGATSIWASQPQMLLQFLTSSPTQLLPTKNVVPYGQYDVYKTVQGGNIAAGATITQTSNNIQLSFVPDLLFIFARVPIAQQTNLNSASFFKINAISLTFSNISGILSGAQSQDLYEICLKNGLNMSWPEWSGLAQVEVGGNNFAASQVPTTGSILVLNPSLDMGISSSTLTNGSIGQFNLQYRLTFTNQSADAQPWEIVTIAFQTGIFVSSNGQSVQNLGLITKQLCLDTFEEQARDPLTSREVQRMVGGSIDHMGSVAPMHHVLKALKSHRQMQGAGGPMSGGAISGGGAPVSGGIMDKIKRSRRHSSC